MRSFLRFVLLSCCFVFSLSPSSTVAGERWRPDDLVFADQAREATLSPDGRLLAWVLRSADRERDRQVSNLMLTSLADGGEVALTRGFDTVREPRWSPDGKRLAFLSTRAQPRAPGAGEGKPAKEGEAQLWLFTLPGGEARPLTSEASGIVSFRWRDGGAIVYAAEERPTRRALAAEERQDEAIAVEDPRDEPFVRLYALAVESGERSPLTDNRDWIADFALSPDGRFAAAVHQKHLAFQWDQRVWPELWIWDLAQGKGVKAALPERSAPSALAWAADGSGFFFVAPYSRHPRFAVAAIAKLYRCERAGAAVTEVDLGEPRGLGLGEVWPTPDGGFLALLADGVRYRPMRFRREAGRYVATPLAGEGVGNLFELALAADGGSVAYASSSAARFEQWYVARLDGERLVEPRPATKLNERLAASRFLARTEIVRWRGAREEEVEGILYYPKQHDPARRAPLILMIHGGPDAADLDRFEDDWAYAAHLYAERGAFVLKANYHGSANYGLDFVESICCGKYYDLEVVDLERGVDFLIGRGLVDPQRVATHGWSNGAILSTALTVANPERYRAAAVGAGDVEWISDWANVDFGHAFDSYYFGASPLENPQRYLDKSPFFRLDRVRTPTLIFHGTEDRNVPTGQGWSHFRALYHLERVPVRFVLFPGAAHGLRKPSHQLRKLEEEIAWFERYLFATAVEGEAALAAGSPLARALALRQVSATQGRYGLPLGGDGRRLRPEVVPFAGLEVGRFEVTRAQWAAFDRAYRVPPDSDNLPITGISFERAQAYVGWLSKVTGERYRLPTAEEAERLYGESDGENTLDEWAGYAPNPDDTARLLAAAERGLAGPAPLLKPVGAMLASPTAEDAPPLFDLGGNAAEWTVSADGQGVARGGCACRPRAALAGEAPPPAAYIGLRVVREGEASATAAAAARH